jgi:cyanate lyase
MKRADLTGKTSTASEKADVETHLRRDRRHVAVPDHPRAARPDEAHQAAGRQGRRPVRAPAETAMLNEVPMRGQGVPMPPTDPLIYRFYELEMVNGPA